MVSWFSFFWNGSFSSLLFSYSVFGLVIMASSCNVPCVKRNFFFLLTGMGKGLFNMFVGSLLFVNSDSLMIVAGWAMIASGLIFIFLSRVKKMSDDDLNRAISLYADQQKN